MMKKGFNHYLKNRHAQYFFFSLLFALINTFCLKKVAQNYLLDFALLLISSSYSLFLFKKIFISMERPNALVVEKDPNEICSKVTTSVDDKENNPESLLEYQENNRNCPKSLKNKELVAAITDYITQNIQEDLSIDRLAEKFYISSSHIRKIFRDEMGGTIKEYIDNLRMNTAKQLLENTNEKISKIALKVGYTSLQAFSRAFKIQTGETPGEYRSQKIFRIKQ